MKLTPADIRARFENDDLKLAFIGMSNIGKSYTAKRLADAFGFDLIDIDHEIQKLLGKNSMAEFARWQGQPYEPGYKDRETESIAREYQATQAAIENASGNVILDTAGSVIYTGSSVLQSLKDNFNIIYITADEADLMRLQSLYFEKPKPLIWTDHFKADPRRSNKENIVACYPALMRARAKAYDLLADRKLSSGFILSHDAHAIFEELST